MSFYQDIVNGKEYINTMPRRSG